MQKMQAEFTINPNREWFSRFAMERAEQVVAELQAMQPGAERLQAARDAYAAIYVSMVQGDVRELEQLCTQIIRNEVHDER